MFQLGRKQPPVEKPARLLNIVVADDVEEIRGLVALWLREVGHTVFPASTGREVIQLARNHALDLVITDLVMPGVDGLDAILAVNRISPSTRILAISGGGRDMPVDAGLRLAKGVGADGLLSKPFVRKQLLVAIDQAMRM